MDHVYDFATIGFRPKPSTGEFVTVGVLIHEAGTRRIHYELFGPSAAQRVSLLFPDLPQGTYENAIGGLRQQLDVLAEPADDRPEDDPPADIVVNPADPTDNKYDGFFSAIITQRDGLINYPAKGRLMAASPRRALDGLKTGFLQQGSFSLSTPIRETGDYDIVVANPPWK